jgi:hypothetical protein
MLSHLDDLRAAFCLATGVAVENIARDGYDVSTPNVRAYKEAQRQSGGMIAPWHSRPG